MDDVNDMNESIDTAGGLNTRISRRDMIKASVVAGGLVWSAPLLLSGRAAADTAVDACCPNGTPVTVKVTSMAGVDCNGTSCIDMRANGTMFQSFSSVCSEFVTCLNETFGTKKLITVNNFKGNPGAATITLVQGITVVSVSAKTSNTCFFTDCPCLSTTHTGGGSCPNTDINGNPTPSNPITVNASGTNTVIDVSGISPLTQIQMTLCLSPQITGMCA